MFAAVEMIFGPQRGPVEDADLTDHYPWPERDGRPWVRAMMVSTLDGAAAGADGLSGSISGDADGAVFTAVRRFADAVLVGGAPSRRRSTAPCARPTRTSLRGRSAARPRHPSSPSSPAR